jgi:hypothetical protein
MSHTSQLPVETNHRAGDQLANVRSGKYLVSNTFLETVYLQAQPAAAVG